MKAHLGWGFFAAAVICPAVLALGYFAGLIPFEPPGWLTTVAEAALWTYVGWQARDTWAHRQAAKREEKPDG